MNALDYFLKANLYAGLFAGCYWLLLRRHTFFGLNRAYLLASVVLSLTLPLASLPTRTLDKLPVTLTAPVGVIALPAVTVSSTLTTDPSMLAAGSFPVAAGSDWSVLAVWVYTAVALLLLLRLIWRVTKLLRFIYASARERRDGYVLVQPNDAHTPTFSFFRCLVLNPADADNTLILQHELVHVQQGHSADVLALATVRAVFWACPALGLLERAVREVHEFLADRVAIRQVTDQPVRQGVEQYARFLVEYAFGVRPDGLTNGFFNPSLLKRRIQMMQQRATNRWAMGKYALVLPLAFALLAMTTERETITSVFLNNITITGRVTSATDGKPLQGVTIVVKGTRLGTNTNADGKYQLTKLTEPVSLVCSFIGFATKAVKVDGKSVINVALQPSPNELNKITVTVYENNHTAPVSTTTPPSSSTSTTGGVYTAPEGKVFTVVEQQPEFVGGRSALGQYLSRTPRYPAKAKQEGVTGTVWIQFTVANDGRVVDAFVMKGIGGGCNEEALRVVNQMPLWRPGKQNGEPVAVRYILPVEFVIDREDKSTGYNDLKYEPLNSPIGDFPVSKSGEFPNTRQPMFGTVDAKVFDIAPSYDGTIRIRGTGPLGTLGEEPLYILDSTEVSGDFIKKLNPNLIQNMTILKDASAKALYGKKGEHGVVIVTTKKP